MQRIRSSHANRRIDTGLRDPLLCSQTLTKIKMIKVKLTITDGPNGPIEIDDITGDTQTESELSLLSDLRLALEETSEKYRKNRTEEAKKRRSIQG